MEYKIKDIKEMTTKFITELEKGDIIVFTDEINVNTMMTVIIDNIINEKEVIVKYKEMEMSKNKYFDRTIDVKEKELKYTNYGKGKRINEESDNFIIPIGSVVKLNVGEKVRIDKRLIRNKENKYSEYLGVILDDIENHEQQVVFNNEDITEIVYPGYQKKEIFKNGIIIKEKMSKLKLEKEKEVKEVSKEDISLIN